MSDMTDSPRSVRPLAYRASIAFALFVAVLLLLPSQESWRSSGPIVAGHVGVDCADCHTEASGTMRQQLQANMRALVGMREDGADFAHAAIENADCEACHVNEGDAHPVYRFQEPRFAEVREILGPTQCVSCHAEHTGKRATVSPTMCQHCHEEMDFRDDPVEPTHAELVLDEAWESCMGCHDFHGNHITEVPTNIDDAAAIEAVQAYLDGGSSPYGNELRYEALTTRSDRVSGETE